MGHWDRAKILKVEGAALPENDIAWTSHAWVGAARYGHTGQNFSVEPGADGAVAEP